MSVFMKPTVEDFSYTNLHYLTDTPKRFGTRRIHPQGVFRL
jgi:hypothetical protein